MTCETCKDISDFYENNSGDYVSICPDCGATKVRSDFLDKIYQAKRAFELDKQLQEYIKTHKWLARFL